MIATYSEYIQNHVLDTGGLHFPGEHHFVSVYLVPRLYMIPFLGVPDFVNPDGMKAIPGDIVYYDRSSVDGKWTMKLGIEVKIGSLKFSRTEYNQWMTDFAINNLRPQLFIGIARQGMLMGDWDTFATRFKNVVYPNGTAPELLDVKSKSQRYTDSRALTKIVHDTDCVLVESQRALPDTLSWWPFASDQDEATKSERRFFESLTLFCRRAVTSKPVATDIA